MSETEQLCALIEKELLAVEKFHCYMFDHNIVNIFTDHQSLVSIISMSIDTIENNRLKKLKLKPINYNFSLENLLEKYMFNADL